MGKMKKGEVISIDKSQQKQLSKQTKNLKKKLKEGTITLKEHRKPKITAKQERGLMYIGHIPHGFYENEMKNYFKQFGNVTNVKVCRSKKTGNSKGYGFVEFSHPEVAKIAAETMNNYLMFKKRVVAEYIPSEKRPKYLFAKKSVNPQLIPVFYRNKQRHINNSQVDNTVHLERAKSRLSKLTKKLDRLKKMGVSSDFQPNDSDVPIVKQEEESDDEIIHIYESSPLDSEVEFKIPLKKSKKSVKSLASKASSKKSKTNSLKSGSSNKVLLAKSLDSVKTLLSSKTSSMCNSVPKKVNKATSTEKFRKSKEKKVKKTRGIIKKAKNVKPLTADTVKKIARELIRKKGKSLLNYVNASDTKKTQKKKSKK